MICKHCKNDKPKGEMATWGGKVTETCLDCKAEKKAARNGAKLPTPEVPRLPGPLIIEVAPSMGFTAQLEGDQLVIAQDNAKRADDPDNITLSKDEAKVLFAMFGGWAGVL
jgi:hypothetical protein